MSRGSWLVFVQETELYWGFISYDVQIDVYW
jgi:hypothetical protein